MNTENLIKIIGLFAWPLVALIGGIFIFIFFRKEVSSFINRIRSVGKGSIETTSGAREEAAAKTGNTARREFMENPQSVVLSEQEQRIKADLISRGLESNNKDTIDVLVRELAQTQLDNAFLDTYYLIYGSELRLLQHLNSITGAAYTDGQLSRYVDVVRAQFPNRPNIESRESFMSVLVVSNLVTRNDNGYFITELGREFLAWIVRQGKRQDLSN